MSGFNCDFRASSNIFASFTWWRSLKKFLFLSSSYTALLALPGSSFVDGCLKTTQEQFKNNFN
jgi:uncharacterized protein (DUF486 family)